MQIKIETRKKRLFHFHKVFPDFIYISMKTDKIN